MGSALSSSPTFKALANRVKQLEQGTAARFIVSAAIVNGHLIFTFNDATTIDAGVIGGTTPVAPPVFTTAASITSDGTPQVGETLIGNSGVVTGGTITARQWFLGNIAIAGATGATYLPTQIGAISFETTATGSTGLTTTSRSASVTVTAATTPIPISISGTPPTTGMVGVPYNFTPTTTNGSGAKTFALTSGVLLGGLSFSTSTGAITGTPNTAGTMSGLVVSVTDSTRTVSTAATSVTIAEAGTVITPTPNPAPAAQTFASSADTGFIDTSSTKPFAECDVPASGGYIIDLWVGANAAGTSYNYVRVQNGTLASFRNSAGGEDSNSVSIPAGSRIRALQDGNVVRLFYTPAGGSITQAAVRPGTNFGNYAKVSREFGAATNIVIGGNDVPVQVTASTLDSSKFLMADLAYTGSPVGWDMAIYSGDTLVVAGAQMTTVSNTQPGVASVKATTKAGPAQEGSNLTYRIYPRGAPQSYAPTTLLYPGTPSFGTNIGNFAVFTPFDTDRALANLLKSGDMSDSNNPPGFRAGLNMNTGAINSLPAGPIYWGMGKPDADGELELTWDGDPNAVFSTSEADNGAGALKLSYGPMSTPAPNKRRFTVSNIDWTTVQYAFLKISSVGTGISNLDLREVGMSKSLWWAPSYVTRQSLIKGPIRDMDVVRTNAQVSGTLEWADRATPSTLYFTNYGAGLPLEYLIQLANLTGRPLWHNLYYNASADYNLKSAQALDTGANTTNGVGLLPGIPLLAEPINEGWNPGFAINNAMRQRGYNEGRLTIEERDNTIPDGYNRGVFKEQAFAHDRIMERVEAGVTSGRTLIRIAGIQIHGQAYQWSELLKYGITRVDAVAAAPYWKVEDSALPSDLSPASVGPLMLAAMNTTMNELNGCGQAVRATGKRFFCYEGGRDYYGNSRFGAAQQSAFKRSSQEGEIYTSFVQRWKVEHGDVLCHYADCARDWGLMEYKDQPSNQTPAWNAYLAVQPQ